MRKITPLSPRKNNALLQQYTLTPQNYYVIFFAVSDMAGLELGLE